MAYSKTQFKQWTLPGPVPPGALSGEPNLEEGESLDAISGHLCLFQLKKGHRYSTDDVLVAWYGTSWCPSAGAVLDLGSGTGSVSTVAAWRLPGARFVTVEIQSESVRLARKSAAWNGLTERVDIRHGDLRSSKVLAADETFDLITASPPYFPLETGLEGNHPQKVACRFELRGTIADYCVTAARHLAPGGFFAVVFPVSPSHQEQRVVEAASAAGLTIVRSRQVLFRQDEPALIGLFGLMRSSDLPPAQRNQTWIEPPLTVRLRDGRHHPEYQAVSMSFGFPP